MLSFLRHKCPEMHIKKNPTDGISFVDSKKSSKGVAGQVWIIKIELSIGFFNMKISTQFCISQLKFRRTAYSKGREILETYLLLTEAQGPWDKLFSQRREKAAIVLLLDEELHIN